MKNHFLLGCLLIASLQDAAAQSESVRTMHPPDSASFRHFDPHWGRIKTSLQLTFGGSLQEAYRPDGKDFTRKFVEVGLQRLTDVSACGAPNKAHGLAVEYSPGKEAVWGFRYGGWATYGAFGLGLHCVYYTDFQRGSFKLRPKILLGGRPGMLAIGFNIPTFRNDDYRPLRKSLMQLSLNFHLGLKTLRDTNLRTPSHRI